MERFSAPPFDGTIFSRLSFETAPFSIKKETKGLSIKFISKSSDYKNNFKFQVIVGLMLMTVMFLRTLCYHNSSNYAKKMTKSGSPIFSPLPTSLERHKIFHLLKNRLFFYQFSSFSASLAPSPFFYLWTRLPFIIFKKYLSFLKNIDPSNKKLKMCCFFLKSVQKMLVLILR